MWIWHDLLTDEPEAVADALCAVFGWTSKPTKGACRLFQGERLIAQVLPLGEDAAPHWIPHLSVPDLDAVLRRLAFVQGELLLEPEDVPDTGRVALIADPAGAVLQLLQLGPELRPPVAAGALTLLYAPRPDLGARVLQTLFGWTKAPGPVTPDGPCVWMRAGEDTVALLVPTPKQPPVPPQWSFAWRHEDPNQGLAVALMRGCRLLAGPIAVGDEAAFVLHDSRGAVFGIVGSTSEQT